MSMQPTSIKRGHGQNQISGDAEKNREGAKTADAPQHRQAGAAAEGAVRQ
jgi:hypothetical protein